MINAQKRAKFPPITSTALTKILIRAIVRKILFYFLIMGINSTVLDQAAFFNLIFFLQKISILQKF